MKKLVAYLLAVGLTLTAVPALALDIESTEYLKNDTRGSKYLDAERSASGGITEEPSVNEDLGALVDEETMRSLKSGLEIDVDKADTKARAAEGAANEMTGSPAEELEPRDLHRELPEIIVRSNPERGTGFVYDVVEIDGDKYAVLTPKGLGIAYRADSDYIAVFTQDYVQQREVFDLFYENPIGVVASMIEDKLHMNIMDLESGVSVLVYQLEGLWEELYPDTNSLSDSEIQSLMMFLESCGFQNAKRETFGYAGKHSYFMFDYSDTEGCVVLFTTTGGKIANVIYTAQTEEEVVKGLELVEKLTFKAF